MEMWTKDRVVSIIQGFHMEGTPLNFKSINNDHPELRKKAENFFGSWGNAVGAAGLNYEEIKRNKGCGKPFLAFDGVLYTSQLEGLVANELYNLKSKNKIVDYQTQQVVAPGRSLVCDFLITLLNGAKFWLEAGKIENNKKYSQLKKRLEYYKKANFFFYNISSANNVRNIIDRFTSWFTLPVKNCVITSHENPDGDAISSMVALYDYIVENGKEAVIKIGGDIPKNLLWLFNGRNIVKKIPDWTELVYVLDCSPDKSRIGWEIPGLPVYNIDHHDFRESENDPDNDIHVIKSCSTASLLFSRFGLKNDILTVGVYTDTLFTKNIYEVLHFLDQIGIEEDELSSYICRINVNPDKKLWDLIQESKIRHCRNGFVIVETDDEYSPDTIETFMQVLMKLNESICLIYGKNKTVKLRTSNINLDVSDIARQYGGGGHPYASMCNILGKAADFKSKITSLTILRE
jgi:phosphoesterase RecJ-like protein